jgi:serine/threonine protein kinase
MIKTTRESFFINDGAVAITPYYGSIKSGNHDNALKNITIKVNDQYYKIRGIEIAHSSEVKRRAGNDFNPDNWYSIGTGSSQLLINKLQVQQGIKKIASDESKKIKNCLEGHPKVYFKLKSSLTNTPSKKAISIQFINRKHNLGPIEVGETLTPDNWYNVSIDGSRAYINNNDVNKALQSLKAEQEKTILNSFLQTIGSDTKIEAIKYPPQAAGTLSRILAAFSRVFCKFFQAINPWSVHKIMPKDIEGPDATVTCIMNPKGNLEIVAKIKLGEGTSKIIQLAKSIRGKDNSQHNEKRKYFILAKPTQRTCPMQVANEILISKKLVEAGIPNILLMKKIRRMNSNKIGVVMEYCDGGNFLEYAVSHSDSTHKVLSQYRKQHISFMHDVVKSLCEMHKRTKTIHMDVKAENLLIKMSDHPKICLSDFNLSLKKGTSSQTAPGTYPPPELMHQLYTQRLKNFKELYVNKDPTLRKMVDSDIEKVKKECEEQKISNEETLKRQSQKLLALFYSNAKIQDYLENFPSKGVQASEAVDAWAFGVLLFEAMYPGNKISCKLAFTNSVECLKAARKEIDQMLNPIDPVDQIIRKLLNEDPAKRITLKKAKELLESA